MVASGRGSTWRNWGEVMHLFLSALFTTVNVLVLFLQTFYDFPSSKNSREQLWKLLNIFYDFWGFLHVGKWFKRQRDGFFGV